MIQVWCTKRYSFAPAHNFIALNGEHIYSSLPVLSNSGEHQNKQKNDVRVFCAKKSSNFYGNNRQTCLWFQIEFSRYLHVKQQKSQLYNTLKWKVFLGLCYWQVKNFCWSENLNLLTAVCDRRYKKSICASVNILFSNNLTFLLLKKFSLCKSCTYTEFRKILANFQYLLL
jgi:hypothetical protein